MEKNFVARSLMHFIVKKAYNDRKLFLTLHNRMVWQSKQIGIL